MKNILYAAAAALLIISASGAFGVESGTINLTVVDQETGKPIPFRLYLKTPKGTGRRLPNLPFWTDHNTIDSGRLDLKLPTGYYEFEIESSPEYTTRKGRLDMPRNGTDAQTVSLQRVGRMREEGWSCADLDNWRSVLEMPVLFRAEGLDFVPIVTWDNSGKNYWESNKLPRPLISSAGRGCYIYPMAGRYEVSGCCVNIFNLPEPVLSQDDKSQRADAVGYLQSIKQQYPDAWIDCANIAMDDLPILVSLGLIDSVEILDACVGRTYMDVPDQGRPYDRELYPNLKDQVRWKQSIYFHLLNCGYRIPPTAGSGSGKSKNPLGYNRVYVKLDSQWSVPDFWACLKKGQAVVTNGPLITPTVNGFPPGHVFKGKTEYNGKHALLSLELNLTLATREQIDYIEIIKNGESYKTYRMDDAQKDADNKLPSVDFEDSGWFLVRVVTESPDTYRCAISAPFYVEFDGKPYVNRQSVQYFQKWMVDLGLKLKEQKDRLPPETFKVQAQRWKEARDVWLGK